MIVRVYCWGRYYYDGAGVSSYENIKNKPQTSEQEGSIQQSTYQFESLQQGRSVPRTCAIIIVGHGDHNQLVGGDIDNQLRQVQN